jgi:hypothetical protein
MGDRTTRRPGPSLLSDPAIKINRAYAGLAVAEHLCNPDGGDDTTRNPLFEIEYVDCCSIVRKMPGHLEILRTVTAG